MPDEPVTIRGGSLTIQAPGGRRFRETNGPNGAEYDHPNTAQGRITRVEIFDQGQPQNIPINNRNARIVIHYDVPENV